jgi:hypothetical protein
MGRGMSYLFGIYSFYALLDEYSIVLFTTAVSGYSPHKYLGNIAGGDPWLAVSYPHVHNVILFHQTLQWNKNTGKNITLFFVLFGSHYSRTAKSYLLHREKEDEEVRQEDKV